MKLRNSDNIEMMDVKSIERRGDDLVIKGKMMGTMAATILIRPEELWAAFRMLPLRTVLALPLLLAKGWATAYRSKQEQAPPPKSPSNTRPRT